MAQAFPIPLECLQLVITNLAIKHELKTLASLLRVSKHVCLATLPILYEDPFVWFMRRDQGQENHYVLNSYKSVIPVIRLLFASVPEHSYSGLIKAMYGIGNQFHEVASASEGSPVADDSSSPSTLQHWPIDYLFYVRQFCPQDQDSKSVLADLLTHVEMDPRLKSYVEKHRLAETYAETALNLGEDWRSRSDYKEDPTTINYLKLNIHREATWALCSPILEQLQSIVIPLSDIGRYHDSITRLSSLTNVTFRLDELSDINEQSLGQLDAEEVKKLGPLQKKRRQDLETAVEFVRVHTVMFRGTLRQVLCPRMSSSWRYNRQSCPSDTLNRMLEFLPALIEPTELVNKNWRQFVVKAEHTNLDHVTRIEVWDNFVLESRDHLKSRPFLHRCPSLRKYSMISLGPDSFKWAVQKDFSNHGQVHDQHERQVARSAASVPPLEEIHIQANKEPYGSELEDIGRGFGATIKTLTIQGHFRQTLEAESQSLTIGHGWRMPVLSRLRINFSSEKMVVDPEFLCYCPSLKVLALCDFQLTYDLAEIKVGFPAYLSDLKSLILGGAGALSFHPDTLHSTKELRILALGSRGSHRLTVIPSFQDVDGDDHQQNAIEADSDSTVSLIHRPKWTWDWHLPFLNSLHLTVEYALHFQFRMLQSTPNLRDLHLCIYSTVHPVERVLTNDDFTVSRLLDHGQEDNTGSSYGDGSDGSDVTGPDPIATTSPKDPRDTFDLHIQSTETLNRIHRYLVGLNEDRKYAAERAQRHQQQTSRAPDQTPPDEQQLRFSRESIMSRNLRQIHWDVLHFCPSHPDGDCPEKNNSEVAVKVAHKIEELVGQAGLRTELEEIVAELQVWQEGEREEEEALKRYRVEHPDHLVVPSVKKLELFGRWIMSDDVLKTLLGRVFRNVQELNECLTGGYNMDTLVRVTQSSMPALRSVHSINPFDPASVSDEFKLQPDLDVFKRRPPFINDARTRVRYMFLGSQSYYRARDEPVEQTGEASVE